MNYVTPKELQIHRALNSNRDSITIDGEEHAIQTSNGSRTLRYDGKLFIRFAKNNPRVTKMPFQRASTLSDTFVIKSQCSWGKITNTKSIPLQDFSNE